MQQITKFYVKSAVYEIESHGETSVMLLNYGGNTYEGIGKRSKRIEAIAQEMLTKKHNVNFAYKFNAKIGESKI